MGAKRRALVAAGEASPHSLRNSWVAQVLLAAGLGLICGWTDVVCFQRFGAFVGMLTGCSIGIGTAAANGIASNAEFYAAVIFAHLVGVALYHFLKKMYPQSRTASILALPMAMLIVAGDVAYVVFGCSRWQILFFAPAFGAQSQISSGAPLKVHTTMVTGCLHKLAYAAAARLSGGLPADERLGVAVAGSVVAGTVVGVALCVVFTRWIGSNRWCFLPVALLQACLLWTHDRLFRQAPNMS